MSRQTHTFASVVPIPLPDTELKEIVQKAKDWALMHGAAMRSKATFSQDVLQFAPFILFPSAFPRKEFQKSVAIQPILNEMMHRVAHNPEFLRSSLEETVQVDEFTGNLFKIYETVLQEGITQPLSLGLLRSDLMLETSCSVPDKDCHHDTPYCCWKQVEINTIAAGFGWLGPASAHIQRNSDYHDYNTRSLDLTRPPQFRLTKSAKNSLDFDLYNKLPRQVKLLTAGNLKQLSKVLFFLAVSTQLANSNKQISLGLLRSDYMVHKDADNKIKQVEINTIASSFGGISSLFTAFNRFVLQELGHSNKLLNLPENNALRGLCEGMIEAWKIYGNEKAAILFVVEEVTYNICDQRFHEFELAKLQPNLKVKRCTLTQIADQACLNANNELVISDGVVAVVYFRAGYEPSHYPSQREWDARLLMERSQAIKCPSIQYHLAGTKKVQQSLARYGAVEMFLGDAHKIEAVKEIFTGLYSLDFDERGDQAVQMALDSPERFVLKPQREGGGNNVYGLQVREAMLQMKNSRERTAWILMDRINPPITAGYMIRPGGPDIPEIVDLVSELGIFGVIIGDSQKIISNKQVGHMLRTKISTANEGGVAAGLGALDSPYLVD